MTAAERLREIDRILPTNEDVFSGDTRQGAFDDLREALPLLASLVEAAETYRAAVDGGREDEGLALQVTYRDFVGCLADLEARLSGAEARQHKDKG